MPRRPQGIGSLDERPPGSGTWRWRMRSGADPVTGKSRMLTATIKAKTRSAAQKQVQAILADLDEHPATGSSAPLSAVLEDWLRHTEARGRSPHTIDSARRCVHNVLVPALGDVPVGQLTGRQIDAFYDELLARPVSPATVRRHHAVLSAALGQAVKWGWIIVNPCSMASPPPVPRKPLVVPGNEEIHAIVRSLTQMNEVYGMAAFLAASTGARRGELCALRWTDFHDGLLDISASLWRIGGETGTKSTKSGRERIIPVVGAIAEAMATWYDRCTRLAETASVTMPLDAYILSSWPDGTRPINPDSLSSAFSRTAKALDLGHIHFHSLRHFVATEMLAAGISPKDAADVLGHANPTMTLNVYAHSTADRQRAAMEAIGRALR